ncbi:unnamed protein product [Soboliphyme baturini]|uniref:MCM_lid domain-containing protein n=1 Tax=Soboliphyme baturini TaxID=241478 RepID=A0A183J519_9BILA|nr:unnamed protein product [Soboliphyme baturini]
MLDPQDEYYDRRLATHVVSLYYITREDEEAESLDMSLLRDYISYAKTTCNPVISDQAAQLLVEKYTGSGVGQVSAYPRQLESLIRLSEALAKIKLSNAVSEQDVEEASRLHREALKQSAIDPLTGKVDINILAVGMSSSARKHVSELCEALKKYFASKQQFGAWVSTKKLLMEIRENSDRMVSREIFEEAVNELCKNDVLVRGRESRLRLSKPIILAHESAE